MEFHQLRYFVTLVEQSTFTKAASTLHISQPSLSASIKKLESELGLLLLNRSTRNQQLTTEGKIFYEEAKNLIRHFEYMEEEMKRLKNNGPLELSIGFIESAEFWIPKILKRFSKEFPKVTIRLSEILSREDVIEALVSLHVHLVITNQYINHPNVSVIPIYKEKLVVLLPSNHPLQDKENVLLDDLKEENFIISKEGFQTRHDVLNAFQQSGFKPNIQIEMERFETACSLVEQGLGITVVPENYIKYVRKNTFKIKQLGDLHITRVVYLAYTNNRYLPPNVLRFFEMVKEFFDEPFTKGIDSP